MQISIAAAALLAFVAPGLAQQLLPDPATCQPAIDAESARLEKAWLHSGDPRQMAWAAELIARDGRRHLIPDLIEGLDLPDAGTKNPIALRAIADALIQLEAQVPADWVMKLPHGFSAQQVILLARSPDNRGQLMQIFKEARTPLVWLAAANLLAADPDADFANLLLDSFHVGANLRVVTPENTYGTCGGGCGGSWESEIADPLWPPVNFYELSLTRGALFTSGVHPVRYYSYQNNRDRSKVDCSATSRDPFVPGLLAQVARIPANELRLAAKMDEEIVYRGTDLYVGSLHRLLSPINEDFERLVRAYVWLGYLRPDEAISIKLPVELTILDLRTVPEPSLPPPLEYASLALRVHGR